MSLILEALKRSEKERQQRAQSVTDTLYIQTAKPQQRLWPWLLVGLLLINLGVLAFLWWQDASKPNLQPMTTGTAILEQAHENEPITLSSVTAPAATPVAPRVTPPVAAKPVATTPAETINHETPKLPLGIAMSVDAHPKPRTQRTPVAPARAVEKSAANARKTTADVSTEGPTNAPAADADQLQQLQNYELNTIVYSDKPSKRYALVNMQKLREGNTLPGSQFRIEAITRQGLIIDLGDGLVRYSGQP